MRVAFALSGFHRVDRGAEVALLAVAEELARSGDDVTVFGSGPPRAGTAYRFRQIPSIRRERFQRIPSFPIFRGDVMWEDASFAIALLARYRPADFDAVITCAFPFTQWALRRAAFKRRPAQIFVTQNGDWPAVARNAEYRTFWCDGLVCTNPDFEERNRDRWRTVLIPNGIYPERFGDGPPERARFNLPENKKIVLAVSALIDTKRMADAVRAVAPVADAHLVIAGDGPLRDDIHALADKIMPGRFTRLSLSAADMPALYRSADAFLHMSLLESFGNVFVEAMASGLPVVGHDTPRLRWIVGDDQLLCDTTDVRSLDVALRAAITRGRVLPTRVQPILPGPQLPRATTISSLNYAQNSTSADRQTLNKRFYGP